MSLLQTTSYFTHHIADCSRIWHSANLLTFSCFPLGYFHLIIVFSKVTLKIEHIRVNNIIILKIQATLNFIFSFCLFKHNLVLLKSTYPKPCLEAFLVVQWLRIHLPMQGTRVRALVQEDPTCCRATKPVHHNY